jgi:hypothetical protein
MCYSDMLENNKKYILTKLKNSGMPENHPFNCKNIINSGEILELALLLMVLDGEEVLNRFIKNIGQQTTYEIFYQHWIEVHLLFSIVMSLINEGNALPEIVFDYKLSSAHRKDVDFMLAFTPESKKINIEVKRITCDPLLKEGKVSNGLFVKKLFKNTDLNKMMADDELKKFSILQSSTHYQTIKDEVKKINEKFSETSDRENFLNVGVLCFDFATSFEEFISYFAHSTKGLLTHDRRIFKNIDLIVIGHNNPRFDIDNLFQNYVFVCNEKIRSLDIELLEKIGFGNVIYNNCALIYEELKQYSEQEYIKGRVVKSHGILGFYVLDISEEEIEEYHRTLAEGVIHKYPCIS